MSLARPRPETRKASRLRLPHPRGLSSSIGRVGAFRRLWGPVAVVGAGATWAAAQALGHVGLFLGSVVTAAALFGFWSRGRTLRANVDDQHVRLPAAGLVLPRGRGELVVQAVERKTKNGTAFRWDLSHSLAGVIARDCPLPLVVRAAAEGLAVAGEWPIVWRSPVEELERRGPRELDVPLAVREAREPAIPRYRFRPPGSSYDAVALEGGAVRLVYMGGIVGRFRTETWSQLLAFGILSVPLAASIGWWTLPLGFLPALLLAPLATPDVEVSRGGVVLRHRVLGVQLFRRRIPTAAIESIYVDTLPGRRVVAVGDAFHTTLAHVGDAFEAAWLRGVVVRVLVGDAETATSEGPAASSAEAAASAALATTAAQDDDDGVGRCPSCTHAGLEHLGGPLDEHVCPACAGRFLPAGGAARLVEEELGITRDMLRELTRYFAGERRTCPSCRSRTSAVRLKGVTADLCQGCGGLWLDPGELGGLSAGRYEG